MRLHGFLILLFLGIAAGSGSAQQPKKKAADLKEWLKQAGTLSVEEQIKAAAEKLKELNGGFDGKMSPVIRNGKVVELTLPAVYVSDISPLAIFPDLEG